MQFVSDAAVEGRTETFDPEQFLLSLPSQQEVLLRAHHLLEVGWCKGRYRLTPEEQNAKYGLVSDWLDTGHDRYCMVGAIRQAAIDVGYKGNVAPIIERVRVAAGIKEGPVVIWNDQSYRTKAEVLSAIDRAICLAVSDY